MAQSFSFFPRSQRLELPNRPTVAVTGAAGRIGSYFSAHSADRYNLILLDHPDVGIPVELKSLGEVRTADLTDLEAVRRGLSGADVILHLGVKRVIFASSIHAVSGYPTEYQVHPDDPVNPADLYGVTKAFGEALGRYYAEQHGLSVIAVRIAAFQPHGHRTCRGTPRIRTTG